MQLSDLIGKTYKLYGADATTFRIQEGDAPPITVEAVEDPDDGYRSCLGELRVVEDSTGLVFPALPVAEVTGRWAPDGEYYRSDIVQLVDADGHEWLSVGTDNYDDYYPSFVFTYTPKAP